MAEEVGCEPKFRSGTKVWRIVSSRSQVACKGCGGGGQVYDEPTDMRAPCGACSGAGMKEADIWHTDTVSRRATTCIRHPNGEYCYFLEGVDGPVFQGDLFNAWATATMEAGRRTEEASA